MAYYDKQHMLHYASWCNDVIMSDSLTSAHSFTVAFYDTINWLTDTLKQK